MTILLPWYDIHIVRHAYEVLRILHQRPLDNAITFLDGILSSPLTLTLVNMVNLAVEYMSRFLGI